jgi:hypothetical protein
MVEFGVGLKFRSGKGKIDLAIQGGNTGSISSNLIENRTIRIYLGVSGAETWQRHRQAEF